jgi:hypothetical protein
VKASVHDPARPWSPDPVAKCLFLNKSRNLLKVPTRISVATDSGEISSADDVRYLLFDEDEVELSGIDYAAAVAVCLRYCFERDPDMSIAIDDLVNDSRLWPRGVCPINGNVVSFFREHLQRHSFNGIIEVSTKRSPASLKLEKCKIGVIKAQANASPAPIRPA